jgi:exonuclease III
MVLVSWNCNGALRTKFHLLDSFAADVLVIQECEDPAQAQASDYREWASNYVWSGSNKSRGLGIFARKSVELANMGLDPHGLQCFLACTINRELSVLGVWTRQSESRAYRYIGQLWKYLHIHREALEGKSTVVVGDLNSNACWDKKHPQCSHTQVVELLASMGLQSLYHHVRAEPQALEKVATFYLHRKLDRDYHIDYAFIPERWLGAATLDIGRPTDWLAHSDHMPLRIQLPVAALPAPTNRGHDEI